MPRKKKTGAAALDPELYKEFRALAKRADQRAVRLERYAQRLGYEAITGDRKSTRLNSSHIL